MPTPDSAVTVGGFLPAAGINLNFNAYYNPAQAFLNVFMMANMDRWPNTHPVDEDGWPTSTDTGTWQTSLLNNLPAENTSMAGRYVLEYEGTGTVWVTGQGSPVTIISDEPGRIVFDYDPADHTGILIRVAGVDPSDTGDYVRDISLVQEQWVDLYEAGATFNPVWMELVEDFGLLRFMDWGRTNASEIVEWSERAQVTDATYGSPDNGVPIEMMVELANQAGADPWFNIPLLASDDYIQQMAAYILENLDPDLHPHFELSNEVWNRGASFLQTYQADALGIEMFGDQFGDYPFRQYYGYRAAEAMDLINDVFGAASDRAVGVLGSWANSNSASQNAMVGVQIYADEAGVTIPELFDSLAVTWYFNHNSVGVPQATFIGWMNDFGQATAVDMMFDALMTVPTLLPTALATHATVAAFYGIDLTSYEGGTHINYNGNDPVILALYNALNTDARMGPVYERVLDEWISYGGGAAVAYSDFSLNTFGNIQHHDDVDSARWIAIHDYNETRTATWLDGRSASDFDQGITEFGSNAVDNLDGTAEEDYLISRGGADTLNGRGGNDGLNGGNGEDILYGAGGDDTLIGGRHSDQLFGGSGADLLEGGDGSDSLFGGSGDDFLDGGNGNDTINGGNGDDQAFGGSGADTINGGSGSDDLRGGSQADTLFGGNGQDHVYGGTGNDIVHGDNGADDLRGGNGADTLFGGSHADRISGGNGNDEMTGGAGADTFVFGASHGSDQIVDFQDGLDVIEFTTNGLTFGDLTISASGGSDVEITSAEGTITIQNVSLGDIDASDFLFT